jgi:hypothetical protein
MMHEPAPIPVTTPELETVATLELEVDHEPPEGDPLRLIVDPAFTLLDP